MTYSYISALQPRSGFFKFSAGGFLLVVSCQCGSAGKMVSGADSWQWSMHTRAHTYPPTQEINKALVGKKHKYNSRCQIKKKKKNQKKNKALFYSEDKILLNEKHVHELKKSNYKRVQQLWMSQDFNQRNNDRRCREEMIGAITVRAYRLPQLHFALYVNQIITLMRTKTSEIFNQWPENSPGSWLSPLTIHFGCFNEPCCCQTYQTNKHEDRRRFD